MKLRTTLTLSAGLLAAACSLAETPEKESQPAPAVARAVDAPPGEGAKLSVDELLERNFAALGGRERLRAVRTLRLEATQVEKGASAAVKVFWKRPDRLRIEAPNENLDTLQVFDGERAWFTYPALPGFEIQNLEGADREALRAQADLVEGPTFDYAAKGHRVELLGKERLPGTQSEAWRILLTTAQGDVRTLWFDAATFLQVREERREYRAQGEVTVVSVLSDFRTVGGLLFAHRVESWATAGVPAAGAGAQSGADVSLFTIQKLELDVDLPDALFALPAVAPTLPLPRPSPAAPAPPPAGQG